MVAITSSAGKAPETMQLWYKTVLLQGLLPKSCKTPKIKEKSYRKYQATNATWDWEAYSPLLQFYFIFKI